MRHAVATLILLNLVLMHSPASAASAVEQCLAQAKADYEAGMPQRVHERDKLEIQLRKVCVSGQFQAVKIALNEFLYSEFLRPRFEGIQACLTANGESLPEGMDPKGKDIIADGKKYCEMLLQ